MNRANSPLFSVKTDSPFSHYPSYMKYFANPTPSPPPTPTAQDGNTHEMLHKESSISLGTTETEELVS